MTHRLDKYVAYLDKIIEANKTIIVSDEAEAQKIVSKLLEAQSIVIRQRRSIRGLIEKEAKLVLPKK